MSASRTPSANPSGHPVAQPAAPDQTPGERLPRAARVLAKADFDRCFAARCRVGGAHLFLQWRLAPEQSAARIGLAVGRKADPRAVGRNRIKRLVREAFRRHAVRHLPVDIVAGARHTARTIDVETLMHELNTLFDRVAAALPQAAPQGTMRGAPEASEPSDGSAPRSAADEAPPHSRIS